MLEWPKGANDDCPNQEELLLASDGELSARRNEAILAHARRCARCREHLATHRTTVNRVNDLGQDDMSAPRRPAGHLEAFQQRLRQEVARDQQQQQQTVVARPRFQRLHTRRWLPIAAAVPLLATAFIFSSRYTETLRADDLLKGAINEQRIGSTGRMQRVQVSLIMPTAGAPAAADPASSLFTREFGAAPAIAAGRSDQERQLAERLRSLHFNLDEPLSAVNFEMWRSTRASKRDSVEYRENRQHRALTTTTEDGEVQRAEIVVRLHDWHAIAQTLRFRDGRELISRELATWTVDAPPATPNFAPPASKAPTERADAKRSIEAPRANAADATEALPTIGLRQWRQKTFDGGPSVETFGPQLSRSVDRLRATARALVADSRKSAMPAGAAAAPATDGQPDGRAQERYRAFRRELDEVERQLTLFLGTPTYQGNSTDVPADLERRARTIAAQADALRTTVRTLLVQDDVPIRQEIEAGAVEPEVLAAVRRALDALWHTVTPTP